MDRGGGGSVPAEGVLYCIGIRLDRGLMMDSEHYSVACYRAIDAELSTLLEDRTERPAWYAAWQRLTLESPEEERLSVYQAIRDSGLLPEDAGFNLVYWHLEQIVERLADTVLGEFDHRLDAIRSAHGLAEDQSAESPIEGLSLLHREEDGFWDVDIFPDAIELVGGADHGAIVNPVFSVDLEQLRSLFESVDDFGWNAFGWHAGEGAFIWVVGLRLGRPIFLRILAEDPRDDVPRTTVSFR